MSLMERVQAVAGRNSMPDQESQKSALPLLRKHLQERLPSDQLARMIARNPTKARNEIHRICKEAFASEALSDWDLTSQQQTALISALLDSVFGLGPLESMLADDTITEIMVNGTDSLYYEREGKLYRSEFVFTSGDEVRSLIDRIIGPLGRRVDEASPMVNARLPQGHRVNAVIPPAAVDGPMLTIRKFSAKVITLPEMELLGSIDGKLRQFLVWAVLAQCNIAVSGGTGTGKTTLLNALSCEISPDHRVITIEDSAELKFNEHPHVVRLEARPVNAEGMGEVTIRDLVINALRMRPDRIIVGECRGAEAIDMLQAMNTGHDGSLTTLHANSPQDAVMRLDTMVRYGASLPVEVIQRQIGAALDLIIQVARSAEGRRYVCQVDQVELTADMGALELVTLYRRELYEDAGSWERVPTFFGKLARLRLADVKEVQRWIKEAHLRSSRS